GGGQGWPYELPAKEPPMIYPSTAFWHPVWGSVDSFPGWHLIGSFPPGERDGVGGWLLHHGGEAMLLEVPPGLRVSSVWSALVRTGASLKFIAASHDHEDHLDVGVWDDLRDAFPDTRMIHPSSIHHDRCFLLGGERVFLVGA